MSERDEPKESRMPAEERRRVVLALRAAAAAPSVTVLFQGASDEWIATA